MTGPDRAQARLRVAGVDDLSARELHDLLRLRVDVFVVEQACAYPEVDGRDVEPTTRHVWLEEDGAPVAVLRVLRDPDAVVLGRVATRADRRGHGYAARLVAAALELVRAERDTLVRIGAQAHLEEWYAGFGFRRSGADYLEDGIPHLPMELVLPGADRGVAGTV
ncbi:GNAT family N-acetyltransferase [Nocardioides solisilvae]|uniref:GNAT family N-acetyltransferase n=1 Tax=Nocardioides solisilvae TaxID=1542435 RepID=UPI000D742C8C|nr:GNAT family N-acetyltransferase [Nocardioides solisilvae]